MITILSYIIKVHFSAVDNLSIFFGISFKAYINPLLSPQKLEGEFSSGNCIDHVLNACSSLGKTIRHLDFRRDPL